MTGRGGVYVGRAVAVAGCLIAVLVSLDVVYGLRNGLDGDAVLYVLERLYFFLPFAAALIVGQLRPGSVRLAIGVCLGATVLMAVQDFAPARESTVLKRTFGYNELDAVWADRQMTGGLLNAAEGGSFKVVLDYASGRLERADLTADVYRETSVRLQVSYGLWKLGYLLAPFAAIGAVLGTRAWVGRNLRARTRAAERLVLFVLAWIVGPVTAVGLMRLTDNMRIAVVQSGYLPLILLPPLGISVAAAFGWRAAARQDALLDAAEALPEID